MWNKIVFRNIVKNFKDYGLYFLTLVFGVCIFYMFNSIDAQQGLMSITGSKNDAMKLLIELMSYLSIVVSFVLGFLIIYANNFFIKRRKKEIGIYQALGMERGQISLLLVLETLVIAMLSLITGLLLGVFFSQFMSVFTAKLFEVDLIAYKFIFSSIALIKTLIYFGIIFVIVILFNVLSINKIKLIDMLQGRRKNETLKLKKTTTSVVLFLMSIVCLGSSYYIINQFEYLTGEMFFLDIILGIIGTVLFFYSLMGFLIAALRKNKRIYYKELNSFVLRQVNNKVNTNFISMSVVSILLLLTIGILSTGISIQTVLSENLENATEYDVYYTKGYINDIPTNYSIEKNLPNNLLDYDQFEGAVEYVQYSNKGQTVRQLHRMDEEYVNSYQNDLTVEYMVLSDYNELAEINGIGRKSLADNEYILASSDTSSRRYVEEYESQDIRVEIAGENLTIKETDDISIGNFPSPVTIVVPDEYRDDLIPVNTNFVIKFKDPEDYSQKYQDEFVKYREKIYDRGDYDNAPFDYATTRYEMYASSITTKTLVSFVAIYLGFVFLITSSAILAIQQLSEATDNKERYALLDKLGVSKRMKNRALFRQIGIYFLLPLGLAVVDAIFGLMAINSSMRILVNMDIAENILWTAGFIVLVYGLYFLITYYGSKKIIK